MTPMNIKGGFAGSGVWPLDPSRVTLPCEKIQKELEEDINSGEPTDQSDQPTADGNNTKFDSSLNLFF